LFGGKRLRLASDSINGLCERVATDLGSVRAIPFARGSTAIYALMRALAIRDGPGEVVMPSLCCETVAMAIVYAGHDVVFADVSPQTLCMSPETVAPLVSGRTRAVIIVHLYGMDAQAQRFAALRALNPHMLLVEDIAQAVGGRTIDGRPLGGTLDASILSFAADKILRGNGGMLTIGQGAAFFADVDVMSSARQHAASGLQPQMAASLRNLVHGLVDIARAHETADVSGRWREAMHDYRDLIVRKGALTQPNLTEACLDQIEGIRAERFSKYSIYRDRIEPTAGHVLQFHPGSTCWRCPILMADAERSREVTAQLRSAGVHASNHYFPLDRLFFDGRLPNSAAAASRIINLWVDELASPWMVDRAVEIINCR